MKSSHIVICASLLIVGVVLFASGVGTAAFPFLVACVLMMGAMVWLMMRPGGTDRGDR